MSDKDIPVLTLEPFGGTSAEAPHANGTEGALSAELPYQEQPLSPAEMTAVHEFASKINIRNSSEIISYGSSAQAKMTSFSESALEKVRAKDMNEIGGMIVDLVGELRGMTEDDKKGGLFGLFKKAGDSAARLKANYTTVEKNVDRIVDSLETHKVTLLKDIAVMDQLYERNLEYYKELTMYILAGKEKLGQVRTSELPELRRKAELSGEQADAQAAKNLAEMCDRFEKKIYDLELTRTITMQMAPQIRMVQNTDSIMVDKIHSSIVNTIPLWKNQLVISLGLAHSKSAIEAQRRVTETTNELLKKNAAMLKEGTVEAAKEAERGIVEIETLRYTNETLISTLDEVLEIQRDGREKRVAAEKELREIEGTLKNKMLEMSGKQ
ncbi:MAG: toxic anion resistance protein [Clostridiales Family XIII bacterium]|jgi:uncharacterized protein YaaN involved in tellurite resistance|nr:toxic anion resistance protein [Clostridiales Family XIII bacterium]